MEREGWQEDEYHEAEQYVQHRGQHDEHLRPLLLAAQLLKGFIYRRK